MPVSEYLRPFRAGSGTRSGLRLSCDRGLCMRSPSVWATSSVRRTRRRAGVRWIRAIARVAILATPATAPVWADSVPTLASLAPYGPVVTSLSRPRGLAILPSGAVYFTDEQDGVLYEVVPGGAPRVVVSGLRKPRGLGAEDAGHLLLVAEKASASDPGPGGVVLRVDVAAGSTSEVARG